MQAVRSARDWAERGAGFASHCFRGNKSPRAGSAAHLSDLASAPVGDDAIIRIDYQAAKKPVRNFSDKKAGSFWSRL
jgi:hypothetical protein